MFTVLLIMTLGVGLGYLLRRWNLKFLPKVISCFIFMLLFVLGVQVGGNPSIMDNLSSIGLDALIIILGALLGSLILARLVYVRFFSGGGLSQERSKR